MYGVDKKWEINYANQDSTLSILVVSNLVLESNSEMKKAAAGKLQPMAL